MQSDMNEHSSFYKIVAATASCSGMVETPQWKLKREQTQYQIPNGLIKKIELFILLSFVECLPLRW